MSDVAKACGDLAEYVRRLEAVAEAARVVLDTGRPDNEASVKADLLALREALRSLDSARDGEGTPG